MIIGFSGEIGSGKDLAGSIVQYIKRSKEFKDWTIQDFKECLGKDPQAGNNISNFEIRKYADKLKEIVALLIGCDRILLEEQDFKENVLGSEWNIYRVKGKYKKESFNLGRQEIFNNIYEIKYTTLEEANSILQILQEKFEEDEGKFTLKVETQTLNPRKILQLLGTEGVRNIIHPNAWINALYTDYYGTTLGIGPSNLSFSGIGTCDLVHKWQYPNWIITDVRYPNEAQAIKDRGGIVVRINRDIVSSNIWQKRYPYPQVIDPDGWDRKNYNYSWYDEKISFDEYLDRVMRSTCMHCRDEENFKKHSSETALDDWNFDYTIQNNGEFEDLYISLLKIL